MPAESLDWTEPGLEPVERARRAVAAQLLIWKLPSDGYRRDRDLFNIRLYENNPVITLYNYAGQYYSDAGSMALPPPEQSANNRAKAAIDTLAAQVSSTDQRGRFKVVDGTYRQRRRARELQNFTDGLARELKLHKKKRRAWLDGSILESGLGAIQFYEENGRCAAQRVLACEFTFDPLDGLVDGYPRRLYRQRPMPRAQVKSKWGGKPALDKLIDDAKVVQTGGAPAEHIMVYESWSLRTDDKAKDGWHVISLEADGGVLLVEAFEQDRHDVVFLAIEERFTTGWGLSLMTQMRPLQIRINANSYRSDRITKLFAAGHLYVNKGSRLEKSKITNEIGSIWEGNGPASEAVSVIQFNGMTADIEEKIERDGQRIFENHGINLDASQAQTNTGVDSSGAAKREEKASSKERNAIRQERWEEFGLECIHAALAVVRRIVEKKGKRAGYKVAVPGKRGLTVSDWKDAALDEKDYVLETRPASWIPTEPEGLIAMGREMVDLQAWTPQKFAGFMQDLDQDGRTSRGMSKERNFEKMFEKLLYDKVAAASPDEFTDYAMALDIGTEYLAQGEEDDVPEKHLERVRRYLKKCKVLDARAKAAGAQQQPAAPAQDASAAPPALAAAA